MALEQIIWNCVLSRTARLHTVITRYAPGKAICVPILWFDSLYLNNLHLSKNAYKVVLDLFAFSRKKNHEQQLIPAKILYQCPSRNILDFVYGGIEFSTGVIFLRQFSTVVIFLRVRHMRHVFLRSGGPFSTTKNDPYVDFWRGSLFVVTPV